MAAARRPLAHARALALAGVLAGVLAVALLARGAEGARQLENSDPLLIFESCHTYNKLIKNDVNLGEQDPKVIHESLCTKVTERLKAPYSTSAVFFRNCKKFLGEACHSECSKLSSLYKNNMWDVRKAIQIKTKFRMNKVACVKCMAEDECEQ